MHLLFFLEELVWEFKNIGDIVLSIELILIDDIIGAGNGAFWLDSDEISTVLFSPNDLSLDFDGHGFVGWQYFESLGMDLFIDFSEDIKCEFLLFIWLFLIIKIIVMKDCLDFDVDIIFDCLDLYRNLNDSWFVKLGYWSFFAYLLSKFVVMV